MRRSLLLALAAAAAAAGSGAPAASAAEPCTKPVHVGPCYVQHPGGGGHNCTIGYAAVGTTEVCLLEWQP